MSTLPDKEEKIMTKYSDLKCWEIISCDHLDCLARCEPDKPCWAIARRIGAFRDVSNTCHDCIVYLLKNDGAVADRKEIEEVLNNRTNPEKIGTGHRTCILKTL